MTRPRPAVPLILLTAAAVRLWGIGFGLPHIIARPDETEVAGPAVGFLSGDLRPPFFEWPTLFVYTVALLYVVYYFFTKPYAPYKTLAAFAESRRQSIAPFLYISRLLSAVMGVATVWWVFAICRRLFDRTTALASALFLALCFLHVRDSHFGATDVAMTAMVVLTVLAILRWRDSGTLIDAAGAGLAGGLASSTKYNGLGVCLPFAIALVQRVLAEREGGRNGESRPTTPGAIQRGLLAAVVFGITLLAGFLGTSPYVAIDWQRFLTAIAGVQAHLMDGHGLNLGRGWTYYARVVLPAALGWPVLAASVAGLVGLFLKRSRDALVLFSYPIAYYIVAGRGLTVFARYIIPVLPFLCIAAGWAVVEAARLAARHQSVRTRALAVSAAVAVCAAPTAYKTLQLDRLLAATDNRSVVARELAATISPDSTFYQSGEHYGYAPTAIDGHPLAHNRTYDEATRQFDPNEPEWILLQRSPLVLYSAVPPGLSAAVADRYDLVRRFSNGEGAAERTYDQQDAFFLPLTHLGGLERPGPEFELYRRRSGR